jgi:hypothetical protein
MERAIHDRKIKEKVDSAKTDKLDELMIDNHAGGVELRSKEGKNDKIIQEVK